MFNSKYLYSDQMIPAVGVDLRRCFSDEDVQPSSLICVNVEVLALGSKAVLDPRKALVFG